MSLLRRFVGYYRPHLRLFLLDLLCASTIAGLELLFPLLTRYMLNTAIPARDLTEVLTVAGGLVVIFGAVAGLQYVVHYWGHVVGIRMEADMRRDIFSHLQRLSFSFYDRNRTGKLMSRVVNDLNEVTELAHHGAEDLFISVIMFSGSVIVLFSIEWRLAIAMLAIVPAMAWFAISKRGSMSRAWRGLREELAEVNAQVENSISGCRVVQAFTNEPYEISRFGTTNDRFRSAKYYAYQRMAVFMTGLGFFQRMLYVVVVGFGGVLVYLGHIAIGDLLAFVLYIGLILQPVQRLTNFTQQFEQGMTGFRRFIEIMDEAPEVADRPGALPLSAATGGVTGRIEFDHVTFSYDEGEHVLRDVHLDIPAGSTVALVGPSGAGKTTMCNLIPRFYDVDAGAVRIDGRDIREVTLQSLRQAIGIVQQDVFLFTGSVLENIRYGKVEADREAVETAAKRAEIHEFIIGLPAGYDTYVGEKGVLLSGGQKQRIAIARAFLKDPPILLLDEATASLDNETEMRIQRALAELSRGRTTLVIAHRLSTIRNADRIAVLTDDGIAEQGTHAELLSRDGLYKRLHEGQPA